MKRASRLSAAVLGAFLIAGCAARGVHIADLQNRPDKYENKTIEQIRAELSAKTGENVVIRRFSRFAIGA